VLFDVVKGHIAGGMLRTGHGPKLGFPVLPQCVSNPARPVVAPLVTQLGEPITHKLAELRLTQDQLAHAAFPVGDMLKADVRAYAHERALPVADKPDSQEICFVPDGDYARFVEQRLPDADRGGVITDAAGRVLGRHDGVHRYTVGQRKGLRLSSTSPLYVLAIKAESRTVVVGDRASLEEQRCDVRDVNWTSGVPPAGPIAVGVQIRHRHEPAAAIVTPAESGRAAVAFDVPQRAVTPGQAAVFYHGDEVVGGGWISNS